MLIYLKRIRTHAFAVSLDRAAGFGGYGYLGLVGRQRRRRRRHAGLAEDTPTGILQSELFSMPRQSLPSHQYSLVRSFFLV